LESEKRNTKPEGSASNSAAPTVNQTSTTPISKSLTQTSTAPSQAEIDEAPELEDVEVGDLMFANMLNLAGESSQSHDPVQEQLGPWRFKNPTTDILEVGFFFPFRPCSLPLRVLLETPN
jgi:hypothetical protein